MVACRMSIKAICCIRTNINPRLNVMFCFINLILGMIRLEELMADHRKFAFILLHCFMINQRHWFIGNDS